MPCTLVAEATSHSPVRTCAPSARFPTHPNKQAISGRLRCMLESPWRDFGVIPAAIWGRFGGAFSSLIVPHLLHNRLPAHNLPPSRSNSLPHNILFSSLRANPPSHDCSPHRSSSAAPLLPHDPRCSILDLRAIRTTPFLAPSLLPCVAAQQNKA